MAQIASHLTKNGFLQKQEKGVERQALLVCAATVGVKQTNTTNHPKEQVKNQTQVQHSSYTPKHLTSAQCGAPAHP